MCLSGKNKAHKHKLSGPVGCSWDDPGNVPGTNRVCPWDKLGFPGTNPGFLLILQSGSPGLSQGQTQFVLGTSPGQRAAERVYVLKVHVPFFVSLPSLGIVV